MQVEAGEARDGSHGTYQPMTASAPSSRPIFFPALDTLRGLFCLIVFFFHFGIVAWQIVLPPQVFQEFYDHFWTIGGFGVPFFFVLSSFLITWLLLEEKVETEKVDVGAFYKRRIIRVWPVYFVALFIGVFIASPLGHEANQLGFLPPFLYFNSNNVIFTATWFGGAPAMAIAPLWSVSVEEQFYVIWPWIARIKWKRVISDAAGILILGGLLSRFLTYEMVTNHNQQFWFSSLCQMDCFGWGALACLACRDGHMAWAQKRSGLIVICVAIGLVAVQALTGTILQLNTISLVGVFSYSAIPALAALLVSSLATPAESTAGIWKTKAGLFMGRLSYAFYAYHGFAISMFGKNIKHDTAEILRAFLAMAVMTFALAWASQVWMERPLQRLRKKLQVVKSGA